MARTHRLPLAGLVVTALVAAGCTLPVFAPHAEGDQSAPGASTWRPCSEIPRELVGRGAPNMTYECTTINVPADWQAVASPGASASPAGDSLEIAMLRIRSAKQRDRIGSLVINPGGPGGSGIDTAVYLSFGSAYGGLPDEVIERFDIVGFDPRGVGRSSPVKCISDADLDASFGSDPDPRSQDEFDELVALNERIGTTCADKYAGQLHLFSTEQAARDMDAIRQAVGDDKLTYLGYSYGTLLGATYAHLFPRNVRALVLDGAVDPQEDFLTGSENQARGFERAFTNFTRWCAATAAACPISPDARAAVTDAIDQARKAPVKGSDGREATPGWVFYAVISSLYSQAGWEQLAAAIDTLRGGDPAGVFELADAYADRDENGHYSNLFDANVTISCADEERSPTVAQSRAQQEQWRAKYPLFGAPLAVGMLTCATWPGQRDPYPTGPANGAPPILVIGTTGDPATPYENAPKLANLLGTGVLLTWEGEGHTAYPQTDCVTSAVNRYLIDLQPPQDDLRCPPR